MSSCPQAIVSLSLAPIHTPSSLLILHDTEVSRLCQGRPPFTTQDPKRDPPAAHARTYAHTSTMAVVATSPQPKLTLPL